MRPRIQGPCDSYDQRLYKCDLAKEPLNGISPWGLWSRSHGTTTIHIWDSEAPRASQPRLVKAGYIWSLVLYLLVRNYTRVCFRRYWNFFFGEKRMDDQYDKSICLYIETALIQRLIYIIWGKSIQSKSQMHHRSIQSIWYITNYIIYAVH